VPDRVKEGINSRAAAATASAGVLKRRWRMDYHSATCHQTPVSPA
jgi:hypothetical protein